MKNNLLEAKWPIIGHQNVIKFLYNCIMTKKLSHAYLFYGPENIGKTLLAKIFTQAIICENNKNAITPCNKCNNCVALNKNIYPDIYLIDLLEEKQDISIEQIKNLQSQLILKSFQENYKIAIINKADKLNAISANALLKTLEEPFDRTIIILLAEDLKVVIPTIVSRCQLVKFQPPSDDLVYNYLYAQGKTREAAKLITNLIQGRIGLIFNDNFNEFLEKFDKEIKDLTDLINSPVYRKLKIIENINKTYANEQLSQLLNNWILFFRDIFYLKINLREKIINSQQMQNLQNFEKRYNLKKLVNILKTLCQIPKQIRMNINSKILLENLILNI